MDPHESAAPAPAPQPHPDPRSEITPTARTERITAIDTLRGFALLGIMLMNIVAMGMNGAAYDNPTAAGGATGWNLKLWAIMHVLAEGKMRCLFSLVFGASIILLTSRLEKHGDAADIYYRRNSWLLLFGILHAYLLWFGDILYPYALCAFLLYPFRKMPAKRLVLIGSMILAITSLSYIGKGFEERDTIKKGEQALAAEASGAKLTPAQEDAKGSYKRWRSTFRPTPEELKKDQEDWRGNPISVIKARAKIASMFHSVPYYHPKHWDIWSMMLLGMGLFKLGFLTAEKPASTYAKMAAVGFLIGLPLNSYTAWLIIRSNFDPVVQSFTEVTYDVGRLSVALGYLGLVMLLCKTATLPRITASLGAVGQMAFSNYILQSVVAAFVFTGYGFKLYGTLERYQLYYVVGAVWIFQMIVSPIWLSHFRFGPLEWVWRSLTYWSAQPMGVAQPDSAPLASNAAAGRTS